MPNAASHRDDRPRNTLTRSITICGKGVHSGKICNMTLHPAATGTGMVFRRVDLPGLPEIRASYDHVLIQELSRRTTLQHGSAKVFTVEHVLSAAVGLGLDDFFCDMDTEEPPFLDGSGVEFVRMIKEAGLTAQPNSAIQVFAITQPLAFADGDAEFAAIPSDDLRVTYFLTSEHPLLRTQSVSAVVNPDSYVSQIAPARTFCFFEEIEALRNAGLIQGASLSSAVVIGRKAIINESLRFPDEPARHKILDFIGDLALLGKPLKGHFMAWRSGHRSNAAFGLFLRKEFGL
jgi:UDP-3-O-[3-hydroxymyristoyl] N-acetylglucosamine deacetylase / 3-hydroxyacyl-[acyl-carrier-protein] dehydratase